MDVYIPITATWSAMELKAPGPPRRGRKKGGEFSSSVSLSSSHRVERETWTPWTRTNCFLLLNMYVCMWWVYIANLQAANNSSDNSNNNNQKKKDITIQPYVYTAHSPSEQSLLYSHSILRELFVFLFVFIIGSLLSADGFSLITFVCLLYVCKASFLLLVSFNGFYWVFAHQRRATLMPSNNPPSFLYRSERN